MKPVLILQPKTMSDRDRKKIEDNGFCVVVSKDPASIKFLDPIPCKSSRTEIEQAAIALSRKCLNGGVFASEYNKNFADKFVQILIKGTPLDPNGTVQEQYQQVFDTAKADEMRRLAREEAKAERLIAKTEKAQ